MNREQALSTIKNLAMSQGFYSNILNQINEFDENQWEQFDKLVADLHDSVDLVMYFES